MALIKPKVPVINWSNPITKGLVFDLPFFEGGGTSPIETITRQPGTFAGTTKPAWVSSFSRGLNFDGTTPSGPAIYYTPSKRGLSIFSVEALLLVRSNGANNAGTFFRPSDGTGSQFALRMDTNKNGLRLQTATSATGGNFDPSVATSLNVPHHFVCTYDGTSSLNGPSLYLDGISQTVVVTTAPTGTFNTTFDSQYIIGNINQTGNVGTRTWDGHIYLIRVYSRILSPSEVIRLYTNPFQIYRKSSFLKSSMFKDQS